MIKNNLFHKVGYGLVPQGSYSKLVTNQVHPPKKNHDNIESIEFPTVNEDVSPIKHGVFPAHEDEDPINY